MKPVHPDRPISGYYKSRMVLRGPLVPIRIMFAKVVDGVPYEPDGRGGPHMTVAIRLGRMVPMQWVWPHCARHPISEAEHNYMIKLYAWALTHAPESPEANPKRPVSESRPIDEPAPAAEPAVDVNTLDIPTF